MKKLAIIGLMGFLGGCAYIMPQAPFDTVEYGELNRLYTYADFYKADCGNLNQAKKDFIELSRISTIIVNYGVDVPYNGPSIAAEAELDKLVQTANTQMQSGDRSQKFCEMKLDAIKESTSTVKSAVAKRRR
jgi:hypothetical protein